MVASNKDHDLTYVAAFSVFLTCCSYLVIVGTEHLVQPLVGQDSLLEHSRSLQVLENETSSNQCFLENNTDICQCTYPRKDGLIIFNPKCTHLAVLLIIPLINAIVGYGTNVLALYMTFYPIDFLGIELYRFTDQPFGLFGWQGISTCEALVARLVTNSPIFDSPHQSRENGSHRVQTHD